jgi:hypothetical protein
VVETTSRLYEPPVTVFDWCDCTEGWALKCRQIENAEADEADRIAQNRRPYRLRRLP